jgi:hypothetical protein
VLRCAEGQRGSRARQLREGLALVGEHIRSIADNLIKAAINITGISFHHNLPKIPFLISPINENLLVHRSVKNNRVKRLVRGWCWTRTGSRWTLCERQIVHQLTSFSLFHRQGIECTD